MSTPSAKDIIKAFSRVVRKKLENGETVQVPGLGTFSVEHRPSEQKEGPDGESYMAPPRDVVTFDPEQ
jgi:nucleoid DNA-binding protein